MAIAGITPILNVSDVPASFAWFESLGWKRGFAWNSRGMIEGAADSDAGGRAHFGSVCASWSDPQGHVHESQIFLCCGGQGSRGTIRPKHPGDDETDGVWMSWWLDGVQALAAMHETCVRLRYDVTMPPTDEPWGSPRVPPAASGWAHVPHLLWLRCRESRIGWRWSSADEGR